LAAAIVDQAPDSLCLSEPDAHVDLMSNAANPKDFVDRLCEEFDAVRRTILGGGSVLDRRSADGAPVTNYFSDPLPGGHRETAFRILSIRRPGLSPDFVLGVKHNALYAAVLPELVRSGRFRIIAFIRDPVDVLMSWRTLDLPISHGRLPAGERFWPALAALSQADLDLTDKQIRICDLLMRRFGQLSDHIAVIPYEVMVADASQLLAAAATRQPACPKLAGVAPLMPQRDDGGRQKAALTERIGHLISAGQLPGVARYYPHYGSKPSRPRF
jgi:hypothetical protein